MGCWRSKKMKCRETKKNLIRFVDGDLPEQENAAIQRHLNDCASCSAQFNMLIKFYPPAEQIQKQPPPPYLWEKLYLKLDSVEDKSLSSLNLMKLVPKLSNFALTFAVFIFSVLLGVYLGGDPQIQAQETFSANTENTVMSELVQETFIDTFDDLPPCSIGNAYLTLKSE